MSRYFHRLWCALSLSTAFIGALSPRPVCGQYIGDISIDQFPFTATRSVDGGGGGYAYIQDWLQMEVGISAVDVRAGSYRLRFLFDETEEVVFAPQTERIDVVAGLGRGNSSGTTRSGSANQVTINWQIDNLSLVSTSGSVKSFYMEYPQVQAKGVGVSEIHYLSSYVQSHGEPYRLRSLESIITIPASWPASALPTSPTMTVFLWIAGAGNFLAVDVPGMAPLAQVVPEPFSIIPLVAAWALFRARPKRL